MKMIEALKEEMSKSHREIQENTTKHVKDMNKTVQDLEMEIEAINQNQNQNKPLRESWRWKNLKNLVVAQFHMAGYSSWSSV